jgi:hypothetical protein
MIDERATIGRYLKKAFVFKVFYSHKNPLLATYKRQFFMLFITKNKKPGKEGFSVSNIAGIFTCFNILCNKLHIQPSFI